MDKIKLNNIVLQAHIGITPEERQMSQPIEVDVTLHMNLEKAMNSDDISDTVNYARVLDTVKAMVTPCNTIEYLAGRIMRGIFHEYVPDRVDVVVRKPWALIRKGVESASVEVSMEAL